MSLDFKTKDFFYPIALLRKHYFLERSQWFPSEKLEQYQYKKLRVLLAHAYRNVPYYTNLFDRLKLSVSDFNSIADLEKIPPLTKALIQQHGPALVARNAKRFSPRRFKTYGTTGKAIEFYLDKNILIMEFCRYWRQWSWAGYRLGQRIADFSTQHFLENQLLSSHLFHFQPIANRLVLNPSLLSQENVPVFVKALKDHRVSFIKATPSVLCIFAMFLKNYNHFL
jgi:phenylacetate-CoA ligase